MSYNRKPNGADDFKKQAQGGGLYPWHWHRDDLMENTPSRDHGISYPEELKLRQLACKFLQEMVIHHQHLKGEHLITGVAAVLVNRFYKFHSFKMFDYRDVAAACYFLAGKNEDSPRKLRHIVTHWWNLKHPHLHQFQSENHYILSCDFIVKLESIVLMTISFDMNVDLPHQHVLKLMQQIEKEKNTNLQRTAYFLVTDILVVTDWSIRYSCMSIATACLNIAAFFHDVQIKDLCTPETADIWFAVGDPSMTLDELEGMTNEFLDIFTNRPDLHTSNLRKIDFKGKIKVKALSPDTSSVLPPPPAAPILAPKKLDMSTYKERQRTNLSAVTTTTTSSPRQSFLPDVQNPVQVKKELDKARRDDRQRHHNRQGSHHSSSSHHSSGQPSHHQRNRHESSSSASSSHRHHEAPSSSSSSSAQRYHEAPSSSNHVHHHQPSTVSNHVHQDPKSRRNSVSHSKNGHNGVHGGNGHINHHHDNHNNGGHVRGSSHHHEEQKVAAHHQNGSHGNSNHHAAVGHHYHQSEHSQHQHQHQTHHVHSSSSGDNHHRGGDRRGSHEHVAEPVRVKREAPEQHHEYHQKVRVKQEVHQYQPEHQSVHVKQEAHDQQQHVNQPVRAKRENPNYQNEYQPEEKRQRTHDNSTFQQHNTVLFGSNTTTGYSESVPMNQSNGKMSDYAMQVGMATSNRAPVSSSGNNQQAMKPTSVYSQMCTNMNRQTSMASIDISPPTSSPPFPLHQIPQQPPLFCAKRGV